ncbi:hypothetical protein PG989_003703 [Apiospora arundinis]
MGGTASVPTDPSKKVQVISAGFSRTGTLSMSLALEKLLDGPVCHGGTQILTREDEYCKTWAKAYQAREAGNKEETLKLVRKATSGFVATADMPPYDFLSEMMELYPDAKVVDVQRDPQRWWDSMEAVMGRVAPWWVGILLAPIPGRRHLATTVNAYSRSTLRLAGLDPTRDSASDLVLRGGPYILEAHHERVRSIVPEEQLLEMKLSDGWSPLCQFLDVPVPDEPLPRVNDTKAADQYANKVILNALGVWLGIFTTVGSILYFAIV